MCVLYNVHNHSANKKPNLLSPLISLCQSPEVSNSAGSVDFTGIKPHSFIHDSTNQLFYTKCWSAITVKYYL